MLTEKNQIKALTLNIAAEIAPATADEIISAVLSTELVSVTEIADAFEEMLEAGILKLELSSDGKNSCVLSDAGKAILPELDGLLSDGIRKTAKRCAVRYHTASIGGDEFISRLEKSDGVFYVICTHKIAGAVICEIKLRFDDEKSAVLAKNNFELRPGAVMNAARAAVTGDVSFLM